jgi:hypothetical protein
MFTIHIVIGRQRAAPLPQYVLFVRCGRRENFGKLLVAERLDRVEMSGLPSRVEAEEYSDGRREGEADED